MGVKGGRAKEETIYWVVIVLLGFIAGLLYFYKQNQLFIISISLAFLIAFFQKQFYKILKVFGL